MIQLGLKAIFLKRTFGKGEPTKRGDEHKIKTLLLCSRGEQNQRRLGSIL